MAEQQAWQRAIASRRRLGRGEGPPPGMDADGWKSLLPLPLQESSPPCPVVSVSQPQARQSPFSFSSSVTVKVQPPSFSAWESITMNSLPGSLCHGPQLYSSYLPHAADHPALERCDVAKGRGRSKQAVLP